MFSLLVSPTAAASIPVTDAALSLDMRLDVRLTAQVLVVDDPPTGCALALSHTASDIVLSDWRPLRLRTLPFILLRCAVYFGMARAYVLFTGTGAGTRLRVESL